MCRIVNLCFILFTFAVLLNSVCGISVSRRPSDVFATEGETADISCDVDRRDTRNQIIGWMHFNTESFISYGRQIMPSLDADKRSRYSIIGSEVDDVFTLHIEGIRSVDAGIYKCGYYGTGGAFTPLVQAVITVRQIAGVVTIPQCRISPVEGRTNPSTLGVGDMVDFICSWKNDSFVSGASWASNGVLLNTKSDNQFVWTRKRLSPNDNGQNFTCTLRTSLGIQVPRTCTVSPFRIPPSAIVLPLVATANVGEAVEFSCRGQGLPQITSFRWTSPSSATEGLLRSYAQPSRIQRLNNNILRISDIRQEDDGTTVSCEVQVPSGMSAMASGTLRVIRNVATTPKVTTSVDNIRHVEKDPPINVPVSTDNIFEKNHEVAVTDEPTDVTLRDTFASFTTVESKHGDIDTTDVLNNETIILNVNRNIIIVLGVSGLVLLLLLIITIIVSTIKICTKDNQRMKLQNGQLPLQVLNNDSYGQLLSPTTTSVQRDHEKTYEEVSLTTIVAMQKEQNEDPPKSPEITEIKKPCPIYATPNKLKRNSSPLPARVVSQYVNMPSERLSQYDTPTPTRPTTPPPPPPPPRYEDVVLPPASSPKRHRPLGPARSCSFKRSSYSALGSEDEFNESASMDDMRTKYLAAFKEEEEGPMEPVDVNHSRGLIEDEYVQLDTRRALNVEGLQYADLDLNENVGGEIRPPQYPTEYARISTMSTPL
ncbi:uncharacterized protein [Amphiura filiformis]|uniref:uncharacterized protein n=1 Tax=Amphiura filiformis TaxID=82378 RepID=UPI003B216BB1